MNGGVGLPHVLEPLWSGITAEPRPLPRTQPIPRTAQKSTVAANILQSKRSRQKRIYKCIADDGHKFLATGILAKGGAHGLTCGNKPWQRRSTRRMPAQ